MAGLINAQPVYGQRQAGAPGVKGQGYLGPLQRPDGQISTELSFDFDVEGKKIYAPLLVPTLDQAEIDYLLSGGKATPGIYKKAQDFAIERLRAGQDPFAGPQDQQR